jgi:hypothetical protein
MMATRLEQSFSDVYWCGAGAMERLSGSFGESFDPALFKSIDPFVAGLAADAVSTAHFGHGIESSGAVGDE